MTNQVHPTKLFSSYVNEFGKSVWQPSGETPGMSVRQLYLASILMGLASNPTTMLNMDDHIDYAIRLAKLAHDRMPD